jgi:imidazolonepropionase-like amidohydrolase
VYTPTYLFCIIFEYSSFLCPFLDIWSNLSIIHAAFIEGGLSEDSVKTMIALKAGYLVDGTGSKPVKNPTVLVEDGRITEVNGGSGSLPQGCEVLEFTDGTILPGLINLHAHLTATPGLFYERFEESEITLTLKALQHANIALGSGVTTIRDCGSPNRVILDLKQAIADKICNGPRLVVSGRVITSTGGHGRNMGIECDGPYSLRKAIRRLVKYDEVDFIKIMVTGGSTPGTFRDYSTFTPEELKAVADESHKLEKRVVAHAAGRGGILTASEAGIDELAHLGMRDRDNREGKYDPEVGKTLAENQTFVHFTFRATYTRLAHLDKDSEDYRSRRAYVNGKMEVLRQLKALGVKIGAGDDGGWSWATWDGFSQELELMAEAGMTPIEAITAATGTAAEAIEMKNQLGTIEAGKIADLFVVKGQPFSNLEDLRNVQLVMKDGEVVRGPRQN